MSKTPPGAPAPKPAASRKQAGRPVPKPATPAAQDVPAPTAASTGRSLTWAIRLLYAQAILTGLFALVTVWIAIAADHASVQSAIAWPAFVALIALIWAGLATALHRRKSLARGPAIVLQMLLIPLGYYMIVGGIAWLGVPTLVIGLFGSGLLLAPATRTALGLK